MIRKYILLLTFGVCALQASAQKSYNEQVQDYIEKFKDFAIAEQRRSGIPASITLAQGIFETAAGNSELCTNASNHFGIKCKNTWEGDTYTYTDDAKDECFRKYESALHSYRDHSDFLKNNKRYSSLFALSPTDYAAWAYGLKRCGYATNPQYAKKLIKTIEDFKLQEYTYAALDGNPEEVLLASAQNSIPRSTTAAMVAGENIPENDGYAQRVQGKEETQEQEDDATGKKVQSQSESGVVDYYLTTTKNGKKGFYAHKGDMLLEYAIKNRIRYAKLLEMNDLPDAPLEADMFIYLEKKSKTGQSATHKVKAGETLLQISQAEGVQIEQLRNFNRLTKDEEPAIGTVLNLQSMADDKPEAYTADVPSGTATTTTNRQTSNTDNAYVAGGKATSTSPRVIEDAQEDDNATTANQRVNIADETPVEEVIAAERAAKQKAPQKPLKDESKMTALEKLKAHMDKTVYADRDFEPKASGNYDDTDNAVASSDEIATTPARKNTIDDRRPERKTKETIKPKAKAKVKSHTVRRGETLFEIAEKYDLTVSQLQKMNKLSSKKIVPGQKLKVAK